jgi:hypothetical protein
MLLAVGNIKGGVGTGVRLSRELAAPTQIGVGSELGAARGVRKSGVIDTQRAPPLSCRSGITDRYSSAPYEAINARHVILTATRVRVRPS